MLRNLDIVCFANDWQSVPTSKRHVMRALARHNRVLWVNSIGCRNPKASGRDFKRIAQKLLAAARPTRLVEPNLWVLSPLAIPFHSHPLARRFNRRFLALMLRAATRRLGFRDFVTWTFVPTSAGVAGALGERLVVYHCVDEFSQFTGVDPEALLALEAELAARADLVLVSSEPLLAAKRRLNPRTFLVRHGVEVDHFGRALDETTPLPADLPRGAGPTIGFFGAVADWVDLELVRFVADARPDWTVVLVGAVETDPAPLAGCRNVHLLGRRSYESLPGYCRGFDVAILPFRRNELTLAANPLKVREYLAAGLPVVATPLPEVERLGPVVRIGRDPREFVAEIEAALENGAGPLRARAELVREESWERRIEEMCAYVERSLAPPLPVAGASAVRLERSGGAA